MEEYNETKQLRLQYPLDLTKDQQKEILDQLPANPVRADMVGLGLHLGYTFESMSELELYWMYQAKLAGAKAREAFDAWTNESSHGKPFLANVQGHLLFCYVQKACEFEGGKDLPIERKFELAKDIFLAWKLVTSKECFDSQLKGFQESLDIHYNVYSNFPDYMKASPQFNKFEKRFADRIKFLRDCG
jgi:hypothetical protein